MVMILVRDKIRDNIYCPNKSFELGIPFDDKDPTGTTIDPHSELLFKSHVAKIGKDDALEQITISSHEGGEKVRWIRTEGSCHEN